jgi:CubicO group peptidase (beta-lactamase class C family)
MHSEAIGQVLRQAAEAGKVAGVAATVATDAGVVFEGGYGVRELGQNAPMTPDTVVWIASMTKAITSAAAMQLVEQGRLSLDAPAAEVLPELAQVQVLEGWNEASEPQLRAPRRPITLRHLLTHTAGFGYDIWNNDLVRYQELHGIPNVISCANLALTTPLLFDPGERWDYGINIDFAGKMVEATSGQQLGEYLRQHLFEPLGMSSTSFKLSPAQRERLASMHARQDDGSLAVYPFEVPQDPEFEMGGGGLYGTVQDYVRFTQMILHGGTFNGNQVLKPETVALMSGNQIGDIDCVELETAMPPFSHNANFFPGVSQKWGLSWLINTETTPQGRSAGSLAWAGLANCFYWIDPVKRVTGVFATQIIPFFDQQAIDLFRQFESAVYQSLKEDVTQGEVVA